MKKFYFKQLFTALLLLCSAIASAHDFEVGGIYYNITDAVNKTVAVTYRGSSYIEYSNEYSGAVIIPASVTNNGTTYSVTHIGYYAFNYCPGLISIEIPNSVTSIGDGAFFGCDGLTSIEIPNSVTSIGEGAFYSCSGLTSIEIPNSVTSIEYSAFSYCSGLTSIVIPNSVTSIGQQAFHNCSGLTSIVIPNSVTSIGNYAFEGCYSLTSVKSYILAENLFAIDSYVFKGVNKSTCTLYVPYGTKATYAATEGWSEFTNIVEMDFTDIDDIETDGTAGSEAIYNLNGQRVENPTKGIYIVNGKKVIY